MDVFLCGPGPQPGTGAGDESDALARRIRIKRDAAIGFRFRDPAGRRPEQHDMLQEARQAVGKRCIGTKDRLTARLGPCNSTPSPAGQGKTMNHEERGPESNSCVRFDFPFRHRRRRSPVSAANPTKTTLGSGTIDCDNTQALAKSAVIDPSACSPLVP